MREIRRWRREGRPLNSAAVDRSWKALQTAGRKRFGSWDRALEAAGLDPAKVRVTRPFDQARVVQAIRDLRKQGKPLNHNAVNDRDWSLVGAAYNYFGSWDAALRAAGIDPWKVKIAKRWSKEDVLRELRKLGAPIPHGRAHDEHRGLYEAVRKLFGGWIPALGAAGFKYEPYQCKKTWTRERIVGLIHDRLRAGKPLKPGVVHVEEGGILKGARREFGGWEAALRAAGVSKRIIDRAMARSRRMAENRRKSARR